jgi:hypothetical protein
VYPFSCIPSLSKSGECNVFSSYFHLPMECDPGVVSIVCPSALTTFMYLPRNLNLCAPQLASECSKHHF